MIGKKNHSSASKAIVPCDKLSNHMFNLDVETFADIIKNQATSECIEGSDRKGNEVATPYWLANAAEYLDLTPLNAFQRELLFLIISEYEKGCRTLTLTETIENMTGGERARTLFDEFRDALDKLGKTWIKVDLAPLLRAFPKYRKRYKGALILHSQLLPCHFLEEGKTDVRTLSLELLAESPLMTVAKLKGQVLTYDTAPLAIPKQNHTERVVVIKNWLLRRVELTKQRGLNPTILVDTFYHECGLDDANKSQKQNARKVAADVLNHFKEKNVIRDWSWRKEGGVYHAIILSV